MKSKKKRAPRATRRPWVEILYVRLSGSNDDPREHMRAIMRKRPLPAYWGMKQVACPAGTGRCLREILGLLEDGERVSLTTKRVDRIAHSLEWGYRFGSFFDRPNFRLFVTHEPSWPPRKPLTREAYLSILRAHNAVYVRKVVKQRRTNLRTPPRKRGSTGYREDQPGEFLFDSPAKFSAWVAKPFEVRLGFDPLEQLPTREAARRVSAILRRRRQKSADGALWNERKVLHVFKKHRRAYAAWKSAPETQRRTPFIVSVWSRQ